MSGLVVVLLDEVDAGELEPQPIVLGVDLEDLLEDLDTVDAREPDIQQDETALMINKEFQTRFPALDGVYRIPFVLEDTGQRFTDAWFVIDDENGIRFHD
jgi:hypothetical protein